VTADGYLVWPGDAVWVKHWWGWEQHTVGQCWPRKIAYTCVDREGYVGSRITKRVYFVRPQTWVVWPAISQAEFDCRMGDYVTIPLTWNCTPRI
jgi:hypothetical protein